MHRDQATEKVPQTPSPTPPDRLIYFSSVSGPEDMILVFFQPCLWASFRKGGARGEVSLPAARRPDWLCAAWPPGRSDLWLSLIGFGCDQFEAILGKRLFSRISKGVAVFIVLIQHSDAFEALDFNQPGDNQL